jgi:hypothetical protein
MLLVRLCFTIHMLVFLKLFHVIYHVIIGR